MYKCVSRYYYLHIWYITITANNTDNMTNMMLFDFSVQHDFTPFNAPSKPILSPQIPHLLDDRCCCYLTNKLKWPCYLLMFLNLNLNYMLLQLLFHFCVIKRTEQSTCSLRQLSFLFKMERHPCLYGISVL